MAVSLGGVKGKIGWSVSWGMWIILSITVISSIYPVVSTVPPNMVKTNVLLHCGLPVSTTNIFSKVRIGWPAWRFADLSDWQVIRISIPMSPGLLCSLTWIRCIIRHWGPPLWLLEIKIWNGNVVKNGISVWIWRSYNVAWLSGLITTTTVPVVCCCRCRLLRRWDLPVIPKIWENRVTKDTNSIWMPS